MLGQLLPVFIGGWLLTNQIAPFTLARSCDSIWLWLFCESVFPNLFIESVELPNIHWFITHIAKISITSPIDVNVPTRALPAGETRASFVRWLAHLNKKRNVTSMFVKRYLPYSWYFSDFVTERLQQSRHQDTNDKDFNPDALRQDSFPSWPTWSSPRWALARKDHDKSIINLKCIITEE